ncbi:hypothetical protein E2C01_101571 [Portunus trituberculatus]|uniref:Uncharacterized protein n=1 Tax=Portunus trituberculatus TaxID=210409 RepID=A0A5B7KB30_PORTR|nr:hypothetical protein [Portunus trituberculatus]
MMSLLITDKLADHDPKLHILQHRGDVAGITIMYKLNVCHVSHLQILRTPVTIKAVTRAPEELMEL